MTNTQIFSDKRTRSQLTLPDLPLILDRSPLKDARTTSRLNHVGLRVNSTTELKQVGGMQEAENNETDDELLLSPHKPKHIIGHSAQYSTAGMNTKRRSSPLRDDYSVVSDRSSGSGLAGREPKRIKRDADPVTEISLPVFSGVENSRHSRHFSTPSAAVRHSQRKRAGTATPTSPLKRLTLTPPPSPKQARARSVPLFPSSYSLNGKIPHLDLRNPPVSPFRARSTSPERMPQLKILTFDSDKRRPEPIIYEAGESNGGMDVDVSGSDPRSIYQNVSSTSELTDSLPPTADSAHQPPQTPSTLLPIQISTITEPSPRINTPPPFASDPFSLPMSPLTPLPTTPFVTKGRYTESADGEYPTWGQVQHNDINPVAKDGKAGAEVEVCSGSLIEPSSKVASTSKCQVGTGSMSRAARTSRLPRLSVLPPVTAPPSAPAFSMGPPPVPAAVNLGANRSWDVKEKLVANAFAVLMNSAKQGKGTSAGIITAKDKGKAKERESASLNISTAAEKPGTRRREPQSTKSGKAKPSVKAGMKPRQKPKPVATFILESQVAQSTSPLSSPRLTPSDEVPRKVIDSLAASASAGTVEMPASLSLDPEPPLSATKESKSPPEVPEKKQTISKPTVGKIAIEGRRITRSVSTKRKQQDNQGSATANKKTTNPDIITSRVVNNELTTNTDSSSSLSEISSSEHFSTTDLAPPLPSQKLSSPQRVSTNPESTAKVIPSARSNSIATSSNSNPSRTTSTSIVTKTPSKLKVQATMKSAPSSPSPSKLSRASSMFVSRPAGEFTSHRLFMTGVNVSGGPSSLSTLATALEKLRMPPPARPNTSMGFNRDKGDSGDDGHGFQSVDDSQIRMPSSEGGGGRANGTETGIGLGRPPGGLQRIATVGSEPSGTSSSGKMDSNAKLPSSSAVSSSTSSKLVQKPLSFALGGVGRMNIQAGRGTIMRGANLTGASRSELKQKPRIFGVGTVGAGLVRGRGVHRVSRKTSLPSVMASPVKGADDDNGLAKFSAPENRMEGVEDDAIGHGDVFTDTPSIVTDADFSQPTFNGSKSKGKSKEKEKNSWKKDASRRASLASQALSQSLSSLPTTGVGLMGPPETPVSVRSASSTYPASNASSSIDRGTASRQGPSTRSATAAKNAPAKTNSLTLGSSEGNASGTPAASHPNSSLESLSILKECTIFVDVRTDDGDDAGGLFVDMLRGMGARILTRVGQRCTHIVYKNGLMSTLNRYRLLHDPRPIVVGIAWVVECVEQRVCVDEAKYTIDLDGVNVAGTTKRRRSMLPKLLSRDLDDVSSSDVEREVGDGDRSMEGSSSSLILDDNLPPLEKARRRKNLPLGST